MIIKQLSVSVEDKAGCCWQVFQTLGDSGVNILAYSIADGIDFGTLRLIVDNVNMAADILTKKNYKLALTDVYCLNIPNETGSLSKVLKLLADENVSISYMYAFQYMGISQSIIRAKDMTKCEAVLTDYERKSLLG